MARVAIAVLLIAALPCPASSADVVRGEVAASTPPRPATVVVSKIIGRASVVDGRTLWFPQGGQKVRFAGIDSCELPQWSYDPRRHGESKIPKPVPCGPFAKAWLKRTVGDACVTCSVSIQTEDGTLVGVCTANGRDLALEMLRVGWARVKGPYPSRPEYLTWQRHAMSARYGMWATYVLDMDEWRRKAIDRTLSRQAIADFNLLAERESEISPPFADAQRRPRRTDR